MDGWWLLYRSPKFSNSILTTLGGVGLRTWGLGVVVGMATAMVGGGMNAVALRTSDVSGTTNILGSRVCACNRLCAKWKS